MSFVIRWLIAFALLAATWNPTRWNYTAWALETGEARLSVAVLAGLVLVIGYVIYLRATLRSIGPVGMALVAALLLAVLWVLYDIGLLEAGNSALNQWLAILVASLVLGVGLSWSIFRRKISGQADVGDVEDD